MRAWCTFTPANYHNIKKKHVSKKFNFSKKKISKYISTVKSIFWQMLSYSKKNRRGYFSFFYPKRDPVLSHIISLHGRYNLYLTWPNQKHLPPIFKFSKNFIFFVGGEVFNGRNSCITLKIDFSFST